MLPLQHQEVHCTALNLREGATLSKTEMIKSEIKWGGGTWRDKANNIAVQQRDLIYTTPYLYNPHFQNCFFVHHPFCTTSICICKTPILIYFYIFIFFTKPIFYNPPFSTPFCTTPIYQTALFYNPHMNSNPFLQLQCLQLPTFTPPPTLIVVVQSSLA